MECTIHQAVKDDFSALADLWEASVRATHAFLKEEDIRFFKPLILNDYLAALKVYYLRDAQGTIDGFIGIEAEKIEMLFLRPEAMGRGIGKKLLSFAISHFAIKKVDVNEQNQQALGFYLHMGFAITARSETDGMGKPFPILSLERSAAIGPVNDLVVLPYLP